MREFFATDEHHAVMAPSSTCAGSSTAAPGAARRTVYVFHCEFSSQRGPEL